jgi:hypothetical protein
MKNNLDYWVPGLCSMFTTPNRTQGFSNWVCSHRREERKGDTYWVGSVTNSTPHTFCCVANSNRSMWVGASPHFHLSRNRPSVWNAVFCSEQTAILLPEPSLTSKMQQASWSTGGGWGWAISTDGQRPTLLCSPYSHWLNHGSEPDSLALYIHTTFLRVWPTLRLWR